MRFVLPSRPFVLKLIRPTSPNDVIGAFDAQRLRHDYLMVLKYFGAEQEFDAQTRAINRYVNGTIRANN